MNDVRKPELAILPVPGREYRRKDALSLKLCQRQPSRLNNVLRFRLRMGRTQRTRDVLTCTSPSPFSPP